MKIELTTFEEHPDGSATCGLDLDNEAMKFLINLGLVTMLKEMVANHKELKPYEQDDHEIPSVGC